MKKESLNFYLYISWSDGDDEDIRFRSYLSVVKTMIKDELSNELQILGEKSFIFSSNYDFEYMKQKMKHKRYQYLLIDVSVSLFENTIHGHLNESSVKEMNNFMEKSTKNYIKHLDIKREDAVFREDFEKAAYYRDEIIKQKIQN